MYARQLAWLAAVPDEETERGKANRKSRYTRLLEYDPEYEASLPELGEEVYLIDLLNEVGPITNNGVGPSAISWLELESWKNSTGTDLSSWEVRTLYALSKKYAVEYHAATDPLRPAPYIGHRDIVPTEAVESKIKGFLNSLKKR